MSTILNLFLLHLIVVFIVDITDFPSTVKKAISWLLTKGVIVKDDYRIHLVDCSLCVYWWSGIIYLLCTHQFTLPYITMTILFACFSDVTKTYIILVKDVMIKITQWIYDKIID